MSDFTKFNGTIITSRYDSLNIEPFAEIFLGKKYAEAKKIADEDCSWDDFFNATGRENFGKWLAYKMLQPKTINDEGIVEKLAHRMEPDLMLHSKDKCEVFCFPAVKCCPFDSSMPLNHPSGDVWYSKVNSPCGNFDLHFYRGEVEDFITQEAVRNWLVDVRKYLRTKAITFNLITPDLRSITFVSHNEFDEMTEFVTT